MSRFDPDPFVEVVAPAEVDEAEALFDEWLRQAGRNRSELRDDDVRVDTIRALDGGTQRRYLVRASSIGGRP